MLVTEVHPGAEISVGQGNSSLFCSVRVLPALPQQPLLIFGEDFLKIRVVSQPLALKPSWETLAEVQPSSPKAARVLQSPAKLPGPGPWAAQSGGCCHPTLQS